VREIPGERITGERAFFMKKRYLKPLCFDL